MSSQPSTIESIRDSANSTYNSVANATTSSTQEKPSYDPNTDPSNFSKDAHGNTFKKGDYKDQLNQAANGELNKEPAPEGIVNKVLAYIPGVDTSKHQPKEEGKAPVNPGQPPNRPDHDVQVEEFLRYQYHSKAGDNMPDPDKQ